MAKVLVLYYSSWGHVEQLAKAVAEGVRDAGAEVVVKRVPELVPEEVARQSHYKLDQDAPIAKPEELGDYDAIIFGTPTRYGNMAAQMKQFIDQTGGLWAKGALVGKVGSVFTSTATQHGGQETTLTSFHTVLLHHGMVIVGLPYAFQGLTEMGVVSGGTPYGASTLAGSDGSRRRSSSTARASRAATSPASRPSSPAESRARCRLPPAPGHPSGKRARKKARIAPSL